MIVGKVSVLLFLSFLVAVLVFVNVVLYSKLQYQERFNGQEKLTTPNILEVRFINLSETSILRIKTIGAT